MSVEKKSLINTQAATKKAIIASKPAPVASGNLSKPLSKSLSKSLSKNLSKSLSKSMSKAAF